MGWEDILHIRAKFGVDQCDNTGQFTSPEKQGAAIPRRATARVPTPLHAAPALTMIRGESRSIRHHSVIITHIFLGSLVERNYRAELVHKRYHAKCLVTSVHRNAPKDMGNDD